MRLHISKRWFSRLSHIYIYIYINAIIEIIYACKYAFCGRTPEGSLSRGQRQIIIIQTYRHCGDVAEEQYESLEIFKGRFHIKIKNRPLQKIFYTYVKKTRARRNFVTNRVRSTNYDVQQPLSDYYPFATERTRERITRTDSKIIISRRDCFDVVA